MFHKLHFYELYIYGVLYDLIPVYYQLFPIFLLNALCSMFYTHYFVYFSYGLSSIICVYPAFCFLCSVFCVLCSILMVYIKCFMRR